MKITTIWNIITLSGPTFYKAGPLSQDFRGFPDSPDKVLDAIVKPSADPPLTEEHLTVRQPRPLMQKDQQPATYVLTLIQYFLLFTKVFHLDPPQCIRKAAWLCQTGELPDYDKVLLKH